MRAVGLRSWWRLLALAGSVLEGVDVLAGVVLGRAELERVELAKAELERAEPTSV